LGAGCVSGPRRSLRVLWAPPSCRADGRAQVRVMSGGASYQLFLSPRSRSVVLAPGSTSGTSGIRAQTVGTHGAALAWSMGAWRLVRGALGASGPSSSASSARGQLSWCRGGQCCCVPGWRAGAPRSLSSCSWRAAFVSVFCGAQVRRRAARISSSSPTRCARRACSLRSALPYCSLRSTSWRVAALHLRVNSCGASLLGQDTRDSARGQLCAAISLASCSLPLDQVVRSLRSIACSLRSGLRVLRARPFAPVFCGLGSGGFGAAPCIGCISGFESCVSLRSLASRCRSHWGPSFRVGGLGSPHSFFGLRLRGPIFPGVWLSVVWASSWRPSSSPSSPSLAVLQFGGFVLPSSGSVLFFVVLLAAPAVAIRASVTRRPSRVLRTSASSEPAP
jgi:hypothetical protein